MDRVEKLREGSDSKQIRVRAICEIEEFSRQRIPEVILKDLSCFIEGLMECSAS